MPLRRGRDVTIAKLACSAFTVRERTRFVEVDARDTHTRTVTHPHMCTHLKHKCCETYPHVNVCICLCTNSKCICIHVGIHIQTCLVVKVNANEVKCWRAGSKSTNTGLTGAGRWTIASPQCRSHYISQTLSLVLDRSWTGTLPSSQMRNVHLMRKEGEWWWGVD